MPRSDKQNIVKAILDRTPESLAGELGIDVVRNTPAPLFQWLIASLLFSARISADIAQRAAKALFAEGWRTPQKMAATSWKERVTILNRSGYARYDESTSRYIGTSTQLLIDTYNGDLRRLRDAANRDPKPSASSSSSSRASATSGATSSSGRCSWSGTSSIRSPTGRRLMPPTSLVWGPMPGTLQAWWPGRTFPGF